MHDYGLSSRHCFIEDVGVLIMADSVHVRTLFWPEASGCISVRFCISHLVVDHLIGHSRIPYPKRTAAPVLAYVRNTMKQIARLKVEVLA